MSTLSFVQVEGDLAVPHIRTLTRLPASFGREWALTPPHSSLRAELRALYAAMMRTMCLSVDAIRAAARWDHYRSPVAVTRAPAAAPVNTSVAASPTSSARGASASGTFAGTPHFKRTTAAPPEHTQTSERSRLAGGAVAIGGAALLTWIIASHTPQETGSTTGNVSARPGASEERDSSRRLADSRAAHEHAVNGAIQQTASQSPAPSAAPVSPPIAEVAPAQAAAQTVADTPAPAAVSPAIQATVSERKPEQAVVVASAAPPDFSVRPRAKTATPARLAQRDARSNGRSAYRCC
jgi:hypothetical protein